jgi:predicted ester cyclase
MALSRSRPRTAKRNGTYRARYSIEEIISEGDKAFARLTYRGTHSGKLFGIAATGRKILWRSAPRKH